MKKLYNLEYLEEISGVDKAFIADMLQDFIQNSPVSMQEIETFVEKSNWQGVYATVHRFIPTFEFVGAEEIRSKLREIEAYSKAQSQVENIPVILNEIKGSLSELIESIKSDIKF